MSAAPVALGAPRTATSVRAAEAWVPVAALVAIGVAGWSLLTGYDRDPGLSLAIVAFTTSSYCAVGLVARRRRPASRFGSLLIAIGLTFPLVTLVGSDVPALFGVGLLVGSIWLATAIHAVASFPSGRLEHPGRRRAVLAAYALLATANGLAAVLDARAGLPDGAPADPLAIWHEPGLADAALRACEGLGVVLIGAVAWDVVRRLRAATPPERRELSPTLWTGAGLAVGSALGLLQDAIAVDVAGVPDAIALACFAALPYAFLLGLGRVRWFRAASVPRLVADLNGAGPLRDALALATGDATLQVAYRLERQGRWVDPGGQAVDLPAPGERRVATEVVRDGEVVGALVHDRALCDDPALLDAAVAAAALQLERERLQAELRARVEELERSRAHLVAAGLAERRRLERDLHDGAQQRLVALGVQVSLAQAKVRADPERAEALLATAREELRHAQEELRELARGIHPAVLTDRGLPAALEALAGRSPVPVEIVALPAEPLPAAVEAAAYFVVAEGLTNVARYARATSASVRVQADGRCVVVEVADDGVGGADPARGSGLRGLGDRLAALDGRLSVVSPPGGGTTLRAELPR